MDFKAVKKIIEQKNHEWANAIIGGDSAAMVNHYMQDGKISPPNSEPVISRSHITAFVSQIMKYGIKEYHHETSELYGNEDNLIEEGNYFIGDGKGNFIDQGKYVAIWRKVDGDWKIYSHIWNTNLPQALAK